MSPVAQKSGVTGPDLQRPAGEVTPVLLDGGVGSDVPRAGVRRSTAVRRCVLAPLRALRRSGVDRPGKSIVNASHALEAHTRKPPGEAAEGSFVRLATHELRRP